MQCSIATVTITGISPLSQSHQHDEPKLQGESHDETHGRGAAVMTELNLVRVPLLTVDRRPFGSSLAESAGHINGWPLTVAVTPVEIHISFADREGPAFVLDLNAIVKAAVAEIEAKLGLPRRSK